MSTPACATCAFFDTTMPNTGRCRFGPPIAQPDAQSPGLWAIVAASDWCGKHTLAR